MTHAPRALAALAVLLPLAGCMGENYGLDSQHQPVVGRNGAHVPGCPDWRSQGSDSAAATMSDYGCATNANLAAMVADPADLLHGRTADPNADVAVRANRAWRETQPSGRQQQITTSVSTGGK